jgi:hypothetical protein
VGSILTQLIKTALGLVTTLKKLIDLSQVSIPLIVAGNEKDLLETINIENVSAIASVNLFNFMGDGL